MEADVTQYCLCNLLLQCLAASQGICMHAPSCLKEGNQHRSDPFCLPLSRMASLRPISFCFRMIDQ